MEPHLVILNDYLPYIPMLFVSLVYNRGLKPNYHGIWLYSFEFLPFPPEDDIEGSKGESQDEALSQELINEYTFCKTDLIIIGKEEEHP